MNDQTNEVLVVLIEDDEFERKLLTHQFSTLGVKNILAYTNGLEAIDQINKRGLYNALIILDLKMPIMDGVAFLGLLKDTQFNGALLLISGGEEKVRFSTARIGTNYGLNVIGHFRKPIGKEQLKLHLNKFLNVTHEKLETLASKKGYSVERFKQALDTGELFNEYLPKVNIKNGNFIGVEALVRWAHPEDGLVLPNAFISLAEESSLIDILFQQVFREALNDWQEWRQAGLDISLSINISMKNLSSPNFILFVEESLITTANPTQGLIFEITESMLVSDYKQVLNILTSLRLRGLNLSVDAYGTGLSSLEQLADIPFNEIKLDKSIIDNISKDQTLYDNSSRYMQGVDNLNIKTIAVGVDDIQDWKYLVGSKCDMAQGYFIGKPMPAHIVKPWSEDWEKRFVAI